MRISACQMISGIDPEQNVLDAVNLISASADSGADLVVLPENFALMAGDAANLGIAEAVGEGPIQDAVRMAAMRCGLWVVAGSIPLKGKDATHYTQSSLVFDPEGNIAARYDRIHLFRLQNKTEFYDERIYIEPGKSPVTFRMTTWDGESFSVGLSLGFDLRFPELFRGLSARPHRVARDLHGNDGPRPLGDAARCTRHREPVLRRSGRPRRTPCLRQAHLGPLQNHRRLGRHGERARLRDGHRDRQHRAQPARERPKHASRARLAHDLLNT